MVKNLLTNAGKHKSFRFDPRVEKIHWRRKWQPSPVFLPGEYHGQRNLVGSDHRIAQNGTQLKRLSTLQQTQVRDV